MKINNLNKLCQRFYKFSAVFSCWVKPNGEIIPVNFDHETKAHNFFENLIGQKNYDKLLDNIIGNTPHEIRDKHIQKILNKLKQIWPEEKAIKAISDILNFKVMKFLIQEEGWIRISSGNVEVYYLDIDNMRKIANVFKIKRILDIDFIDVLSTRKTYKNIPIYILEHGKPSDLRDYI